MPDLYMARIARDDYGAFRRILNDHLPDTYTEWLDLCSKEVTERRAMNIGTVEVEIDPNEFAGFLRAHRGPHDRKTLNDFAAQKAAR